MDDNNLSAQIWESLNRNRKFKAIPPELKKVLRPFVMLIPRIYKKELDELVTLGSLRKARFNFLRYCVENGISQSFADATPDDRLDGLTRGQMSRIIERDLLGAVVDLENLAKNPSPLSDSEIEEIMLSPEIGLYRKTRRLFKQGKLTLKDLLLLQPMLLIKAMEQKEH